MLIYAFLRSLCLYLEITRIKRNKRDGQRLIINRQWNLVIKPTFLRRDNTRIVRTPRLPNGHYNKSIALRSRQIRRLGFELGRPVIRNLVKNTKKAGKYFCQLQFTLGVIDLLLFWNGLATEIRDDSVLFWPKNIISESRICARLEQMLLVYILLS